MSSLAWMQEITEEYFEEEIARKGFFLAEATDRLSYKNPARLAEGVFTVWDEGAIEPWERLPHVVAHVERMKWRRKR